MKINEVEQLTGMTKKNIRFYEEQGLIKPGRNKENGYREYSEDDVKVLRQIKLLRKLGLPLEEIRVMQGGRSTVGDGMRRHLVSLERERRNVDHCLELCRMMQGEECVLADLNAEVFLDKISELERGGTSFRDIKTGDVRRKSYAGALAASVVMLAVFVALFLLMMWGMKVEPEEAPPMALMIIILAVPIASAAGVVIALVQRLKEIRKGEYEDARKY